MGQMLDALRRLQDVELQLATVRRRLRVRSHSVLTRENKIKELQEQFDALQEQVTSRRSESDKLELDLKSKDEKVKKLRESLNHAKTNKEYAAILTEMNTLKADNARIEEDTLKIMSDVDSEKERMEAIKQQIDEQQKALEDARGESQSEIDRLNKMIEQLQIKRKEAAEPIGREELAIFERVAERYDGEAMAPIEIHGKKAPYDYICGGCFMSLNAEQANVLRTRDELRQCDSCHRILYMEPEEQHA
ncbi:MAG: zinc ribbon domain-containing protein [Phycisphaerae bacterium]